MAEPLELAEYEHPDHGLVRVFWRWEPATPPEWKWCPVIVEFDLFTPDSEQEALLEELVAVRVDKSVSVSASEERRGYYVTEAKTDPGTARISIPEGDTS